MIVHVGEKYITPVLDESVSAWILPFSHSPKSRLVLQSRVGRQSSGDLSWELINQLLEMFCDILWY